MKTEENVTFKMAKLLKEKGFDEPCIMFYIGTVKVPVSDITPFPKPKNWNECEGMTSAPTLWQAAKWLREKKGLSVEPYANIVAMWNCRVADLKCFAENVWCGISENSYESALAAGIEAALKII